MDYERGVAEGKRGLEMHCAKTVSLFSRGRNIIDSVNFQYAHMLDELIRMNFLQKWQDDKLIVWQNKWRKMFFPQRAMRNHLISSQSVEFRSQKMSERQLPYGKEQHPELNQINLGF